MRMLIILALVSCLWSAPRVETSKLIIVDTITTIKIDTIKVIKYDTLIISTTFKDTSLIVKCDTAKVVQKSKKEKQR